MARLNKGLFAVVDADKVWFPPWKPLLLYLGRSTADQAVRNLVAFAGMYVNYHRFVADNSRIAHQLVGEKKKKKNENSNIFENF